MKQRRVVAAAACTLLLLAWLQQSALFPQGKEVALSTEPISSHAPIEQVASSAKNGAAVIDELALQENSGDASLETAPPAHKASQVRRSSESWLPPAMQYGGGCTAFGTNIAPPISSPSDEWCAIELMRSDPNPVVYTYEPTCKEDVLRQGNFSRISDILQFQTLPRTDPTSFLRVTDAEREQYWIDNTDPYIAHCRACEGSLVHKTLYRARRWWRMRKWGQRQPSSDGLAKIFGSFIGVHRTFFSTRRGTIGTGGFDLEPFNKTSDLQIPFDVIERILLCFGTAQSRENAYIELQLKNGGHIVMQPQTLECGVKCFWRSMQLLFPSTLAARTFLLPDKCGYSQQAPVTPLPTTPMPKDVEFPFTPCYRNDISNLSRVINATGMMGKRKNFWPFVCEALRNADACGQKARIDERSKGLSQDIRVAVTLGGFVRSFASARQFIFDNLVKPHGAVLFGSTWNVVGRAKKTVAVIKKMTVKPFQMYHTLSGFFGIQSNETFKRLEIHDYLKVFRSHEALKANGFLHPGLYFTLVRSILLVVESQQHFDVVIRSRFDLFAAVPFHFTRIHRADIDFTVAHPNSSASFAYALDVGSSCMMDGMWWPQFAEFHDGKVLKHYADTRMKYFSWQVCDWIDIGTMSTMKEIATIFDWMVEQNGNSAAQFLDHAFFLAKNLTYQPMQLYLKLARHKTQLFG